MAFSINDALLESTRTVCQTPASVPPLGKEWARNIMFIPMAQNTYLIILNCLIGWHYEWNKWHYKELKRLDLFRHKSYSSALLQFRIANYQDVIAQYSYTNYSKFHSFSWLSSTRTKRSVPGIHLWRTTSCRASLDVADTDSLVYGSFKYIMGHRTTQEKT